MRKLIFKLQHFFERNLWNVSPLNVVRDSKLSLELFETRLNPQQTIPIFAHGMSKKYIRTNGQHQSVDQATAFVFDKELQDCALPELELKR